MILYVDISESLTVTFRKMWTLCSDLTPWEEDEQRCCTWETLSNLTPQFQPEVLVLRCAGRRCTIFIVLCSTWLEIERITSQLIIASWFTCCGYLQLLNFNFGQSVSLKVFFLLASKWCSLSPRFKSYLVFMTATTSLSQRHKHVHDKAKEFMWEGKNT